MNLTRHRRMQAEAEAASLLRTTLQAPLGEPQLALIQAAELLECGHLAGLEPPDHPPTPQRCLDLQRLPELNARDDHWGCQGY